VPRAKAPRTAGKRTSPEPPAETILAIDVGNTQTVIGVLEGERVCDLFRVTSGTPRTGDELLPIVERLVAPWSTALAASGRAVVGSVVPSLTPAWAGMVKRLLGRAPLIASAESAAGLRIDLLDPASIGVDRIANAVAVAALYRLPAIVVDLGTATTFDVVLPGPRYAGGAIAPGPATSAEELFRRAARLARVELKPPRRAVGRTTEECIQSGVYWGTCGQIDGLVRRLAQERRIRPFVLATGGLAELFAAGAETIDAVDPALTLQGLRLMEASWRRRRRP
jgi:type III pantothenate kinase